jgi:hypothetical protein
MNMTNDEIAYTIKTIIRGELDDCERALKSGDTRKALRELDGAVTKLRRLANNLE